AAAAVTALQMGVPFEQARTALAAYAGVARRFERRGEVAGITLVDDYAHNPGKVAAVVETARGLAAPGRLVVVFQPHLYSRTRDFAGQLADALGPADVVLVMDVYAAREDPVPGVSGALVADRVTGADARFVPSWSAVAPAVAELARPGDLVLTVGAGDVTMVGPEVLRLLGERPQVPAAGA
ncbi:glutamate ligase domain-containing protein, partial [Oryzihumus sp.]